MVLVPNNSSPKSFGVDPSIQRTCMTQPAQSALSKQSVHTRKASRRRGVGCSVLLGYAQATAYASHVECVEP